MRYSEIIKESLSVPFPYRMIVDGHREIARFRVGKQHGEVIFSRRPNADGACEIIFHIDNKEFMTGGGHSFRILSTVVAAWREFAETHPEVLHYMFLAAVDEPSRLKTYRALIKRFLTNDYSVVENSNRRYITFNVYRSDKTEDQFFS